MSQVCRPRKAVPSAQLKASAPDEYSDTRICCAQWEHHGRTVSADGPILVLCDGLRFQRLAVLAETSQFFSVDLPPASAASNATRQIAEFHILQGRVCGIFMILESRHLLHAIWPQQSTMPWPAMSSEEASIDLAGSADACAEGVTAAATNYCGSALLCAVGSRGDIWLVDAGGTVLTSSCSSALRHATSVATMPDAWVVLSCTSPSSSVHSSTMHAVHVCSLRSLEIQVTVSLGCAQILNVFSWCQTQAPDRSNVASRTVFIASNSPPSVLPVHLGPECPASVNIDRSNSAVCSLAGALQNNAAIVSTASLLRASAPLIALGLSDGCVLVLRGVLHSSGSVRELEVVGRHQLISSGQPSAVVACGFAVWSSQALEEKLALFAASASGKHQLWITKAPASDVTVSEIPQAFDEESSYGHEVAEFVDEPLPPSHELATLIERTALEIEMLEHQQQQLIMDEHGEDEVQRLPEPTPLPTIDVPEPPKISRVARAHCIDPKWARMQRELVDPSEITRAYLDRTCRPQGKSHQPHWVPAEFIRSHRAQQPWETAVEPFSFDPLELHVKNLCQPW